MKSLDLKQATAAIESGGVLSAILKGKGIAFFIEFEMRTGSAALVTANGRKPRAFRNPVKALELVRELGLPEGRFLLQDWRPEDAEFETARRRPERSIALKAAHEAVKYNSWLQQKIDASLANPAPNRSHADAMAAAQAVIDTKFKQQHGKKDLTQA